MHLYEITAEIRKIVDAVDPETGEFAEGATEALDALDMAFDEKAENIAAVIREHEAEASVFSEKANVFLREAKRLSAKATTHRNDVKRLKRYLTEHMEALGVNKVKGKLLSVSLHRCPPSCHIDNLDLVPKEFLVIPKPQASKSEILKSWKSRPRDIPGATIVADKQSVRVR